MAPTTQETARHQLARARLAPRTPRSAHIIPGPPGNVFLLGQACGQPHLQDRSDYGQAGPRAAISLITHARPHRRPAPRGTPHPLLPGCGFRTRRPSRFPDYSDLESKRKALRLSDGRKAYEPSRLLQINVELPPFNFRINRVVQSGLRSSRHSTLREGRCSVTTPSIRRLQANGSMSSPPLAAKSRRFRVAS